MQLFGRIAISIAIVSTTLPALAAGSISATGYGSAVAPPDTVFLKFSLVSEDVATENVLKANGELVTNVTEALKANGIEPRDIQTGSFSLGDAKEPYNCGDLNYQTNEIIPCTFEGFRITTAITLRIRKLEAFGEVVAAAIAAGAEGMDGLTLTVADSDALEDKAYAAALLDARRRAELTATTLGVSLGDLVTAHESSPSYGSGRSGPATLSDGIEYNYKSEGEADLAVLPYGAVISGGELTFNSMADVSYEVAQ